MNTHDDKDITLKCSCGGNLEQSNSRPKLDEVKKLDYEFCGPFPKHKKKRILKKLIKKFYARKLKSPYFHQTLIFPLITPSFKCNSCNKTAGYYRAIATNMFKVEKLSEEDVVDYYKGVEL